MLLRLRFQPGVEFRRNVFESDRRHVGSVMDAKWMSIVPNHRRALRTGRFLEKEILRSGQRRNFAPKGPTRNAGAQRLRAWHPRYNKGATERRPPGRRSPRGEAGSTLAINAAVRPDHQPLRPGTS